MFTITTGFANGFLFKGTSWFFQLVEMLPWQKPTNFSSIFIGFVDFEFWSLTVVWFLWLSEPITILCYVQQPMRLLGQQIMSNCNFCVCQGGQRPSFQVMLTDFEIKKKLLCRVCFFIMKNKWSLCFCASFQLQIMKMSNCGENITDTLGYCLMCHFFVPASFWHHLQLLLKRLTASWNLFVKHLLKDQRVRKSKIKKISI